MLNSSTYSCFNGLYRAIYDTKNISTDSFEL